MKTNLCKLLFCALVALYSVTKVAAQDVIILNDGTKINAKIIEMGENSIKYQPGGDRSNRVISISRTLVAKVKMEEGSGSDILAKDNMTNNYYFNDNKNIIKFGFISFLGDGISLSYERALSPSAAYEITMRYQGIGFYEKTRDYLYGFSISGAYRANFSSSSKKAARSAHILADSYIKPELFFAQNWYDSRLRLPSTSHAGFLLNFGREWVFDNRFSVDLYAGLGFHIQSAPYSRFDNGGFVGGDLLYIDKIALGGGIRIGYVFSTTPQAVKK